MFKLNNLVIRELHSEDLEYLHEFYRFVINHTFKREGIAHLKEEIEMEIETKKKYLEEAVLTNGKKRYFLVALVENQIIASIGYGPVGDLILQETDGEYRHLPEVGSLYVHPQFQKQGVGSKLLQEIFLVLKRNGFKESCFDSGYKEAQQMWKNKFGTPTILLKDYWGEGEHHMIWRRQVNHVQ